MSGHFTDPVKWPVVRDFISHSHPLHTIDARVNIIRGDSFGVVRDN